MNIDDSIAQSYLNGVSADAYKDCWIYRALGGKCLFEDPDQRHREWVSKLCLKLKDQILYYLPRNEKTVRSLFPHFEAIARDCRIMLVVGFPDPYDAMVMEHDGEEYIVFDVIQFGADYLHEEHSCHKVLTHELIHMCLHRDYAKPAGLSYSDELNYIAFDEGFAHALTFPDDIPAFKFDGSLQEKYQSSKAQLQVALRETDTARQRQYLASADTGDYWSKFASMSGMLFLLRNLERIRDIYLSGWAGFANRMW